MDLLFLLIYRRNARKLYQKATIELIFYMNRHKKELRKLWKEREWEKICCYAYHVNRKQETQNRKKREKIGSKLDGVRNSLHPFLGLNAYIRSLGLLFSLFDEMKILHDIMLRITSFPALIDTKTMWVFLSLQEFRGEYVEVEIFWYLTGVVNDEKAEKMMLWLTKSTLVTN